MCNRHRLQLSRHGHIIEYTKYDKNKVTFEKDLAKVSIYKRDGTEIAQTIIDIDDAEKVSQYRLYMYGKYVATRLEKMGKSIFLHHIIFGRNDGFFVDHKNGDKLDNRKSNLCFATCSQNNINRKKVVGIYYDKKNKKYSCSIEKDGEKYWLGRHKTFEEAKNIRIKKEIELFGEFSKYYEKNI